MAKKQTEATGHEEAQAAPELTQEAVEETLRKEEEARTDMRPDLLQRTMDRVLPKGAAALKGGASPIPLRKVSFMVDGAQCAEGVFVSANGDYLLFELTLQALSSAGEINALREVKSGPEAPHVMCKYALHAINGNVLDPEQRNFVWEALGMGGRQIALLAFQQIGAASDAALGKFLSTRRES